jgi:uncharacterized protein (DUF302 family)
MLRSDTMNTATVAAAHVRVESRKSFAEVREGLERRLVRFNLDALPSLLAQPQEAVRRLEEAAGPDGLMLFATRDHGGLLAAVGESRKALQYVVGNPLIALQMTRHDLAAGLYAPLRLLVYEDRAGKTCLEYDRPSSLFGQFHDDRIDAVASKLDRKMEELVAAAAGQ